MTMKFPIAVVAAIVSLAGVCTGDTSAVEYSTVGLCGGFTTFSTLSKESLALAQSGRWDVFALYALGSFSLGLFAVMAGFMLARH
jgi:CrcB protein